MVALRSEITTRIAYPRAETQTLYDAPDRAVRGIAIAIALAVPLWGLVGGGFWLLLAHLH